ncbi:GntR family transcriptional regulator [Sporolactobacillus laevolacticus]|uniref:GntR family transcriptional regulator n=1 Tax=Sporolactobacillus laevolacticus DSM 442 TaxID=1395513 RepID=V6IVW5_9BACL|nr:GntR family transcriptional regulator [Sporolactobacillus laevolacticus]EST11342.1 GntR family transcriptional regulator [Sporolactobacillus laevolacticus DSM 442]
MPIPKIKKVNDHGELSSKEIVYRTLKKWIIEGQLCPLEKLDHNEIANYFSVSRTPVREAFQLLETQNLIQSYPGKSTVVTELEVDNIDELYQPLITLQGLAMSLCIDRCSENNLDHLNQINEEFKRAISLRQTNNILKKDQEFHKYLINMSENQYVIEFCTLLMDHVYRLEYLFFEHNTDLHKSYFEHKDIIEALQRKDSYASPQLVKQHWNRTLMLIQTLTKTEIQ